MDHETTQGDTSPMDQDRAEIQRPDAEPFLGRTFLAVPEGATPEDVREATQALLAARLDAQELEKWEVVPEPDRMPPWSQYRLLSREIESWVTGQVIQMRRGQDIPRDTPVPALRKRLDRAMWLRGGVARVWETEPGGDIFVYLARGPNWKGFSGERLEPLI